MTTNSILLTLNMSSCFDFIANHGESDVDCGGSTCFQRCMEGEQCFMNSDCDNGFCVNGLCIAIKPAKNLFGSGMAAAAPAVITDNDHVSIDLSAALVLFLISLCIIVGGLKYLESSLNAARMRTSLRRNADSILQPFVDE